MSVVVSLSDHWQGSEAPGQAGPIPGTGPGQSETLLGVVAQARKMQSPPGPLIGHAGQQAAKLTLAPVLEHQELPDNCVRILDGPMENVRSANVAPGRIVGRATQTLDGRVENVRRVSVAP